MAKPFTAGPGPDLRTYELGSASGSCLNEPFAVEVSTDGVSWRSVADPLSDGPGLPFAETDLGDDLTPDSWT
jgi:hypothetical protein